MKTSSFRVSVLIRIVALVALAGFAETAAASTPNLAAVRPTGGRRGTEVEVNLTGARLADAREVVFFEPGITIKKLTVVNDGSVKATLAIDKDCRLGTFDFRVRTATGVSEMRTFSVGALAEVVEVEPNNDFAKPQPIATDVVVNGYVENEDVDYYVIDAKKGERISAEVEGIRLGITFFDPYVAIIDAKRFELSSSDDATVAWQDGVAQAVAPADGKYIIQVRESAYGGNGACLYRLHVGRFPRPRAVYPAGGKLGSSVTVKWIGDAAGNRDETIKLPDVPPAGRDFGLYARDDRGVAPFPLPFRLGTLDNTLETEPNDDRAHAVRFVAPAALNGVIEKPGDIDHYVFKGTKGQTYDVKVYARQLRSPLDSVLYMAHASGGAFAANDDAGGPDSAFRVTLPQDGDFYLWLNDHLLKGGPNYVYRVEVAPVAAALALSVPPESPQRGTGTIAVAVAKGNRQAILVNASRADFGGELAILAQGLPPGVALEADPMAANLGTYPVLFVAKPDAAPAASLVALVGKHVDPKVNVPSTFSHVVEFTLGQNNVPVWTRTVDKLAVAVTEEAPFTLDVVEPKVPLVRGGSMNLKVVAKRKPGFNAPISVYLPWNPPGIGSSGGVSIPEKQNEAVIPVNADGGAELKTWRIVVHGDSTGPTGPIRVSSSLAKLTVAQQFLTLAFTAVSVEQGKEVDLPVKINKAVDFPGEAQVTLYGLPNKVVTDVKKINKDTTDLMFHIKTDKTSPAGNNTNLFCQVVITMNGEPITHNLGTGQIRVDVPLPPKVAPAAAPKPAAAAAPKPAAPAPAKVLSRLEKLRLESKQKTAGAAPGGGQ